MTADKTDSVNQAVTRSVADEAAYERQRIIEKLARCSCSWPVVRYRNGDGHASNCPAHVALNGGCFSSDGVCPEHGVTHIAGEVSDGR